MQCRERPTLALEAVVVLARRFVVAGIREQHDDRGARIVAVVRRGTELVAKAKVFGRGRVVYADRVAILLFDQSGDVAPVVRDRHRVLSPCEPLQQRRIVRRIRELRTCV
jgi:hypothetical protein